MYIWSNKTHRANIAYTTLHVYTYSNPLIKIINGELYTSIYTTTVLPDTLLHSIIDTPPRQIKGWPAFLCRRAVCACCAVSYV